MLMWSLRCRGVFAVKGADAVKEDEDYALEPQLVSGYDVTRQN